MIDTLQRWLFVVSLFAATASAREVTITFDEIRSDTYFENVAIDGFRFSPSCHVDVYGTMGFDTSGCLGEPNLIGNRGYLGQLPAIAGSAPVYIDHFERPFSLLRFDYVGEPATQLRSSKGGLLELDQATDWTSIVLRGPDWVGIRWIEVSGACAGAPCRVFDNFTFRVAEPGTPALVAFALAVLLILRRRVRAIWGPVKQSRPT